MTTPKEKIVEIRRHLAEAIRLLDEKIGEDRKLIGAAHRTTTEDNALASDLAPWIDAREDLQSVIDSIETR